MTDKKGATISTFAVIDLETNGLPHLQFNKCSITELSIIAFSSNYVDKKAEQRTTQNENLSNLLRRKSIPELPRVLNKINLMVNPLDRIRDEVEKQTGLSNDALENERPFDKSTADLLISFLQRLEQPVCLVAHNGLGFDFRVLRYVFGKLDLTFPSSILCVDSWRAFQAIDNEIELNNNNNHKTKADCVDVSKDLKPEKDGEISPESISSESFFLEINDSVDWQKFNETTPHRPCKKNHKKLLVDGSDKETPLAKRSLFPRPNQASGFYKLGNIYKRIFQENFEDLHRAENDVIVLSKLILHYGSAFTEYANANAISFKEVKRLGDP
uniref:Exonuclease domain-containing protein n=1 Tax=Glossina brevipalpis TaxID=37001 RepID=A0A1A9WX72_9MUSC